MWYFSWILGTGLACSFAILNAIWLELRNVRETTSATDDENRTLGSPFLT